MRRDVVSLLVLLALLSVGGRWLAAPLETEEMPAFGHADLPSERFPLDPARTTVRLSYCFKMDLRYEVTMAGARSGATVMSTFGSKRAQSLYLPPRTTRLSALEWKQFLDGLEAHDLWSMRNGRSDASWDNRCCSIEVSTGRRRFFRAFKGEHWFESCMGFSEDEVAQMRAWDNASTMTWWFEQLHAQGHFTTLRPFDRLADVDAWSEFLRRGEEDFARERPREADPQMARLRVVP